MTSIQDFLNLYNNQCSVHVTVKVTIADTVIVTVTFKVIVTVTAAMN